MAHAYKEGEAASIPVWFAIFENWIVSQAGWTVVAGAGTTNLTLSSNGESGVLNKLFVNIWRDAGVTTRIRGEVQDDAAGTHKTTRDGYLENQSNTYPKFYYFMVADKDAICISIKKQGASMLYLGLVNPLARTVVDETYKMISAKDIVGLNTVTVLRNSAGVWDQDINWYVSSYQNLYGQPYLFKVGGLPTQICGTAGVGLLGSPIDIISGKIASYIGVACDELDTTGIGGSTAKWKVVESKQTSPGRFAMRMSGGITTQLFNGTWAGQSGIALSYTDFIDNVLIPFLQGRGWVITDNKAISGKWRDYYCDSVGENGSSDIHLRFYLDIVGSNQVWGLVCDSTRANQGQAYSVLWGSLNYIMGGDKDCVYSAYNISATANIIWLGKLIPLALSDYDGSTPYTDYCTGILIVDNLRGTSDFIPLRDIKSGAWNPVEAYLSSLDTGEGAHCLLSNPNNYDGTTYLLFPVYHIAWNGPAVAGSAQRCYNGRMKYIYGSYGGACVAGDTITADDGEIYRVLNWGIANKYICVRII